jgi:putative effector of murein hydrolase
MIHPIKPPTSLKGKAITQPIAWTVELRIPGCPDFVSVVVFVVSLLFTIV